MANHTTPKWRLIETSLWKHIHIYEPVKLADLTRKSLHQVRQVQIWVYKACIYIMEYVNLNLLSADFLFLSEVYSIMSCVVPDFPVISHGKCFFNWSTEATLARSGISAFTYVLPLASIFLSVADTLLLVLLVCFCHPSVVHLPLGRTITASLTLLMLSLVVPLLAYLVSSCQRFFSPYRTSFY